MPKTIIAGNWKMNKSAQEALTFFEALKTELGEVTEREVVVIPPTLFIWEACQHFQDTAIKVGAQNAAYEMSGAFTGETSPSPLAEIGVAYVIVGHSERRQIFKESDEDINKKVKLAIKEGLTPILCVGETLEQREAGEAKSFIAEQLKACLAGMSSEEISKTVIAYEPIWAIGTGKTASSADAEEICAEIRDVLFELADEAVAKEISILYGGSVKANNAGEILNQENINGVLVGGASLEINSFKGIALA